MKKITKLLVTVMIFLIVSMIHIDSKAEEKNKITDYYQIIDKYNIGDKMTLTIPDSTKGVNCSNTVLIKLKVEKDVAVTFITTGEYDDKIEILFENSKGELVERTSVEKGVTQSRIKPYDTGYTTVLYCEYTYYIAVHSSKNQASHTVNISSCSPKKVNRMKSVKNAPVVLPDLNSGYITAEIEYKDGEIRKIYGKTNEYISDVYGNKIKFCISDKYNDVNSGTYKVPVECICAEYVNDGNFEIPDSELSFFNSKDLKKYNNTLDMTNEIRLTENASIYTFSVLKETDYMIGFADKFDNTNKQKCARVMFFSNNGVISKMYDITIDSANDMNYVRLSPGRYYIYLESTNGNVNCRFAKAKAYVAIEKITLPTTKILSVGGSVFLGDELSIVPSYANANIKWTSNNSSVASVSKLGTVIAKKAGEATITVNVDGKISNCLVTVKRGKQKISSFGIKINKKIVSKCTVQNIKKRKKTVKFGATSTDATASFKYRIVKIYRKKANGKFQKIRTNKIKTNIDKLVFSKGLKKGKYKITIEATANATDVSNAAKCKKTFVVTVK